MRNHVLFWPFLERKVSAMKKDIHPKYGDAKIMCACGNVMEVRSTVKEMNVNSCSACHPFYTGKSTFVDATGRVEQFKKRYAKK